MAVDFTFSRSFARTSAILYAGSLVLLEHESQRDRMRRIPLESIEGVLFWRSTPWIQITATALVLGVLGLMFVTLGAGEPVVVGFGAVLIGLGVVIAGIYAAVGKAHIRIQRNGQNIDFALIMRQ